MSQRGSPLQTFVAEFARIRMIHVAALNSGEFSYLWRVQLPLALHR